MTIVHVGELTIGEVVPGATVACDAGVAGINAALPDIQARLAALAGFNPQPFSFDAQLAQAESIVTSTQLAIQFALPAPSLDFQIAMKEAQIAELLVIIEGINAQLSLVLGVQALLVAAGVSAYAYDGPVNGLGAAVTGELAGGLPGASPTASCNALVLVTPLPATWGDMSQLFKVSP